MKKKYLKYLFLFGIFFIIYSCKDDNNDLQFEGKDNSIVAFYFSDGNVDFPVRIKSDSLIFDVEYGFDFTGITPNIFVSEGASISPEPQTVKDWSMDIEFTVLSANKQFRRDYKYVANIADISTNDKTYDKIAHLRTQKEVDAFGAEKYTKVYGIVIDSEEDDKITDISSLNTIEEVFYNIKIKGFYGKSIDGFTNLKRVSTFSFNNDSATVISFPNLEIVTNFLVGYLNDEYVELKSEVSEISCPKLTTVLNDFIVISKLENFVGLQNLSEVGGEMDLRGKLKNFKGFENLTSLNYVNVTSLDLESFEGFENLKSVKNIFQISLCQKLESLDGLQIENIKELIIKDCTYLKNIKGLEKITELNTLELRNCLFLESLEGLHNLKTIRKNLILVKLARKDYSIYPPVSYGLKDLNGLRGLETIGGSFIVKDCFLLEDYSGISNVKGPLNGTWNVIYNAYNPTKEDFLAGKYTKE